MQDTTSPRTHLRISASSALALLVSAAYIGLWTFAPRIRTESLVPVLATTVLSLALIIWLPAQYAHGSRRVRTLLAHALLAGLLIVPLRLGLVMGRPVVPWSSILAVPGLADLIFVWFAATLGCLLSLLLRSANLIPPVAVVLALVDIWTVQFGGPVQRIMESESPVAESVVQAMTVQLPAPTHGASPFPPSSIVGFADFLFVAFFIHAVMRLADGLARYRKTLTVLILVLCAYILLQRFLDPPPALPALVPMAVVMIGMHWRAFHYERSEKLALLYASILIAVLGAAWWLFVWRPSRTARPQERAAAVHPACLAHAAESPGPFSGV